MNPSIIYPRTGNTQTVYLNQVLTDPSILEGNCCKGPRPLGEQVGHLDQRNASGDGAENQKRPLQGGALPAGSDLAGKEA